MPRTDTEAATRPVLPLDSTGTQGDVTGRCIDAVFTRDRQPYVWPTSWARPYVLLVFGDPTLRLTHFKASKRAKHKVGRWVKTSKTHGWDHVKVGIEGLRAGMHPAHASAANVPRQTRGRTRHADLRRTQHRRARHP